MIRRIWITAACASVNESMAPKAYRFPRNVVAPVGIIIRIAAKL